MEEEFIGFEDSLELRKIGFDEPCLKMTILNVGIYGENKEWGILQKPLKNSDSTRIVTHPLWQQAFKWFRINYKIDFPIMENLPEFVSQGGYRYMFNGATYGANTYQDAERLRLIISIQLVKRLQGKQLA
jgi:hypothetical protein